MRVLHVIPGLSPLFGGPPQAVLGMCRQLRDRGVEVEIATTNANVVGTTGIPLGRPVVVEGTTVYCFRSPFLRKYGVSWGLTRWLGSHVKEYDLLHLHALFAHVTGPLVRSARRHKVPYIVRPCGELDPWPLRKSRFRKRIYLSLVGRRCMNEASALHVTCEDERRSAQEFVPGIPCVVVPLGVDLLMDDAVPPQGGFREKHPELGQKTLIVFLSRLDPIKGLDRLLRALGCLSHERDDFAVAIAGSGSGSYERWVRECVLANGLQAKVVFAGFLQGVDKLVLLRDADVFVLPSYHENFGLAVVEAMAAGVPVVISDKVGIHYEVAQGGAGLVTACDSRAIGEALRKLLDDGALRKMMGENGERLVREKFAWEQVATALIDLYESVLSRRPA